jgi:hypothetical protein
MSVKMYGPALDGSGTIVNREVPEADVVAYEQSGYKKGSVDGAPSSEEYGASKAKESETNLDKMTKAELIEEAAKRGVEVSESMTKAEIVAAIEG